MDVFDYLKKYGDKSLKQSPFNEVDALIFASLAYPHYQEIMTTSSHYTRKKMLELLPNFSKEGLSLRSQKYLTLLEEVCKLPRYKKIKFFHFKKEHNEETSKQFQAISFSLGRTLIISFCGTDGTMVGWQEDLNMSFLDITPSEEEAVNYVLEAYKKHPLFMKEIIVVGHSKGGRLAIRAIKEQPHFNRIKRIYAFDAPNFQENFYDEKYRKLEPLVKSYLPEESIFGRLITEPRNYQIVSSTAQLLNQHDMFSWEIKDHHFIYLPAFSKRSNKIVKVINGLANNYTVETKEEFVTALFDLIDRLEIKEMSSLEENMKTFSQAFTKIRGQWKKTPKEQKDVLKRLLFGVAIDYIKESTIGRKNYN